MLIQLYRCIRIARLQQGLFFVFFGRDEVFSMRIISEILIVNGNGYLVTTTPSLFSLGWPSLQYYTKSSFKLFRPSKGGEFDTVLTAGFAPHI